MRLSHIAATLPFLFLAHAAEPSAALLQLRELVTVCIILSYVFSAGKIAEFLQSWGRRITKKEALLAPFAYMLFATLGIMYYFLSGAWVPPQHTIITTAVYLAVVPFAIALIVGALVLYSFFHDRLNALQSLDLSLKVLLSPLLDGISGYWTALVAAALLVFISAASAYSSNMNFSDIPLDFILLSVIFAIFFLYRAFTSADNGGKASNFVTALTLIVPAILRMYFRDLVCAGLALVPFDFFSACPIQDLGTGVELALSVLATLIILIPVIPFVYALVVNTLRFAAVARIVAGKEGK
ncbi:MAG: hypothetical protein PHS02_04095 [Candidatus ainarchaeum sp.]|nr:hypothetical protein [Candidatus ainarchaeum sp.]